MLLDPLKSPPPGAALAKTLIASLCACLLSALCILVDFRAESNYRDASAGTVKDEKGARIVRAEITITSNGTAEQRKVTSDDQEIIAFLFSLPERTW